MQQLIKDNRQFKALKMFAKYAHCRPHTSYTSLDNEKKQITIEAMRIILHGGTKEVMLHKLRRLESDNLHLCGFKLDVKLKRVIDQVERDVLSIPENNNMMSSTTKDEAHFIYESIKLLGRYAIGRINNKKHDQHKLGTVDKAFKILFSTETILQKSDELSSLYDKDIAYETARGKFDNVSPLEYDSYTLRGALRRIVEKFQGLIASSHTIAAPISTLNIEPSAPPLEQMVPAVSTNSAVVFFKLPADKIEQAPADGLLDCPITLERMRDPVITADGHTYERSAIMEWFKTKSISPLTGKSLTDLRLTPNYLVRKMLERTASEPAVQVSHSF